MDIFPFCEKEKASNKNDENWQISSLKLTIENTDVQVGLDMVAVSFKIA